MNSFWVIVISVASTVACIAIVSFLAVVFLRKRHPEVRGNLDQISGGYSTVKGGLLGMRNGAHFIWCYFLIYLWWARTFIGAYVPAMTTSIFVIAGIFTIVELGINFAEALAKAGLAPHAASHAALFLSQQLHHLKELLHGVYTNLYVLSSLLIIEMLIGLHHLREHRHRGREQKMLVELLNLFGPLNEVCVYLDLADRTILDVGTRENQKREAITTFLRYFSKTFQQIFDEHGVRGINVCVMEYESPDQLLRATFDSSDGRDFDPNFVLPEERGAAGRAFTTHKTVYVPDVGYEHAVVVTQHVSNVLPAVYEPSNNPFKSMICSPLIFHSNTVGTIAAQESSDGVPTSKPPGVLNLSSRQSSAFSQADFVVARLGAAILALMYNRGRQ